MVLKDVKAARKAKLELQATLYDRDGKSRATNMLRDNEYDVVKVLTEKNK